MPPGRKAVIEPHIVIEAILARKDQILLPGGKILPKSNVHVWEEISKSLGYKKKAMSLYSFVTDNKYGVRDLLNGQSVNLEVKETVLNQSVDSSVNDSSLDTSQMFQDIVDVKNLEIAMDLRVSILNYLS